MKAIIFSNYGEPSVLKLQEVAKPIPKDDEILIKVFATAVNSADWRLRKPDPILVRLFLGLIKPRIQSLGGVLSGEIEAIGVNVTRFKVGDQVFGSTGFNFGAYAEYKCLKETAILSIKPSNITHNQAATISFGGLTALDFLNRVEIKEGQKVLIYGASGAVGTAGIQLAKYFKAEVTGVCSTKNLELVKNLGATNVIDYTKSDVLTQTNLYGVVFVTINKLSLKQAISLVKPGGKLILSDASFKDMLLSVFYSKFGKIKVHSGVCKEIQGDLDFLRDRLSQGQYQPVIDRVFKLEQMVEAHTFVEAGHKAGNVAISVVE